MISVIQTDDGRVLITDKHTQKDLREVIKEAREDMVDLKGTINDHIDEADITDHSYVLISSILKVE